MFSICDNLFIVCEPESIMLLFVMLQIEERVGYGHCESC